MKIFQTKIVKLADEFTIDNEPIASIDLMERAAYRCTIWLSSFLKDWEHIIIFAGNGNNGGDGLAIARILADSGHKVSLIFAKVSKTVSPDCDTNLERLKTQNLVPIFYASSPSDLPEIKPDSVIIDALFGSGLTRPLDGFAALVVDYLNDSGAKIISIDLPSGLLGEENNQSNSHIVRANFTLTFEFPFLSFFLPENEKYVGDFFIIPIGIHQDFIDKTETNFHVLHELDISRKLKKRNKYAHKGTFGHALLLAGSYGKMGAAVLAAKACLRTGVGLLTVHVPKSGVCILQTALPEAMLSIDADEQVISDLPELSKYHAIGIGPGISTEKKLVAVIKQLFTTYSKPFVVDADALNVLSQNKYFLKLLPPNSILTPHPKEFERLVGTWENDYQRLMKLIEFSTTYHIIVILKGAHTTIASPDGECWFNTTGNPGMATAGSGDVLTGIILSLLAQGYQPWDASLIGVYLHGLSGDIAAKHIAKESIIASDIIDNLSAAFQKIRCENYMELKYKKPSEI